MRHYPSTRRLLTALLALLTGTACVDNAYDLSDISLKISIGADGVTLPLGTIRQVTIDSLVRRAGIEDDLTLENGVYAYKRDSTIHETIDAIGIDPVRNLITAIDPYTFHFSEGSLPETFSVAGVTSNAPVELPSFAFGSEALDPVHIVRSLHAGNAGQDSQPGANYPLPPVNDTEDFTFTFAGIPDQIASVERLRFGGTPAGTPVEVRFSLEALAEAVSSSRLDLRVTLPDTYTLALADTYGGRAAVNGSTFTITDYSFDTPAASFTFYLQSRAVTEPIPPSRTLDFRDRIDFALQCTVTGNGRPAGSGAQPAFTIDLAPSLDNADLHTADIRPAPVEAHTELSFDVDGLDAVTTVDYLAFSNDPSNALVLQAARPQFPLPGEVPVTITFPEGLEFADGIPGLSGYVLTTTLDLLAGGLTLPLHGMHLTGDEAHVSGGVLSVRKPIVTVASPYFPGSASTLTDLTDAPTPQVEIAVRDMHLLLDLSRCQVTAGFSEPIDISHPIRETFAVPAEVGTIDFATVADADTGGEAALTLSLDIADSPVDACYFDDITIVLPAFLEAEHPNLDPVTRTIRIDRVQYRGSRIPIARIVLKGIREVPIRGAGDDKTAWLKGQLLLKATATLPDGSPVAGIESTDITLLPEATVSPLRFSHVTGTVDLDLKQYLEPTTVDLSDLRKSLGDQNIQINLVAPRITLNVNNPIGVGMKGDIVLQPYDFQNQKLDPITVANVMIEPAAGDLPATTHLYVTDGTTAPDGYTLCRVEDLSGLVKIIPSKIDITFDFAVDDTREQQIALTGEDYDFNVDYAILMALQFQDGALIDYSDIADTEKTFEDIEGYDVTADDILLTAKVRSTVPIDLDVRLEPLDKDKIPVEGVTATVLGKIEGYDAATDGEYRITNLEARLDIEDGDIQRLLPIRYIKYHVNGQAVGTDAALSPDQYVSAELQLILKKGITVDLDTLF